MPVFRPCERCAKAIPPELRDGSRFCSTSCRSALAQRRWRASHVAQIQNRDSAYYKKARKLYALVCVGCGRSFGNRHRGQKYCSLLCARQNRARVQVEERERLMAERPTRQKRVVDNGSLPSDLVVDEARRIMFDTRCLMCDRRQRDAAMLTRARARLIAVSGLLPRCGACGGMVYLDEVDLRGTGSAIYGHNEKYAALQRTWRVA